MLTRT